MSKKVELAWSPDARNVEAVQMLLLLLLKRAVRVVHANIRDIQIVYKAVNMVQLQ